MKKGTWIYNENHGRLINLDTGTTIMVVEFDGDFDYEITVNMVFGANEQYAEPEPLYIEVDTLAFLSGDDVVKAFMDKLSEELGAIKVSSLIPDTGK